MLYDAMQIFAIHNYICNSSESSHSIFPGFSTMSDSQDVVDFSSTQFHMSEDSNSEQPFKK